MLRSIADQLEGLQQKHSEYREKIIQYMTDYPDDFAPFVEEDFDEVGNHLNSFKR